MKATEAQIENWLFKNMPKYDKYLIAAYRQVSVRDCRFDILARDILASAWALIEIKRKATIEAFYQIIRYKNVFWEGNEDDRFIIAANDFKPDVYRAAAKHNIELWVVPCQLEELY